MHRLLIVDDETYITDGLYDLFRNEESLELDVMKAYSADEAKKIFGRKKIDILLTDIQMPGSSGLELQKEIAQSWPSCKVVFLTGFDDFSYIYQAMEQSGSAYLLKTEPFEKIVSAVAKAIDAYDADLQLAELSAESERSILALLPRLRADYLAMLIQGDAFANRSLVRQFKELDIRLDPLAPVYLLMGRLNRKAELMTAIERSRFRFHLEDVSQRTFPAHLEILPTWPDAFSPLWFIQPRREVASYGHGELVSTIYDCAETLQEFSLDNYGIAVSFLVDEELVSFTSAANHFGSLAMRLRGLAAHDENLLVRSSDLLSQTSETLIFDIDRINHIPEYLALGWKEELFQLLADIEQEIREIKSWHDNSALEVFYSLSVAFLSYINRNRLTEHLAFHISLAGVTRLDFHENYAEAVGYFRRLATLLLTMKEMEHDEAAQSIPDKVIRYIRTHLAEDLSLTRLAERFSFNPSYLSRLFKQTTGTTLISHINQIKLDEAKRLLGDTDLKIQDVAGNLGFDTPSYFRQFFRRLTGESPQKYRDRVK